MDADATKAESGERRAERSGLSGRWVVVGMFAFGLAATAILWIYWDLHTAPFRPLQEALAKEFPGTRPHVEGGQHKMHEGTPKILRIVMRVPFDPTAEHSKTERFVDRLIPFVREHHDVTAYDRLEIHLFWPEPEQEIKERTIVKEVAQLSLTGQNRQEAKVAK